MAKKVRKIEPVKQRVILELQPRKRVCAYCRVSTDSREQQNSFSAQVEYYKTFIGKRDDWEYTGIYADEAKSGTQVKKRDEFLRMMKECEDCICQLKIRSKDHLILGHFFVNKCASEKHTKAQFF